MESAMANADLGRYRRIVQMFWDPEPSNDIAQDQPVWCLGQQYRIRGRDGDDAETPDVSAVNLGPRHLACTTGDEAGAACPQHIAAPPKNAPDTPPESTASSISSTEYSNLSYEKGWPIKFLSDFESRFWMTYRSEFQPIPRSTDSKATPALSLHVRLRSQLGDNGGFSSDSGWGCMIRSGQSLLANTIGMIRLGRGLNHTQRNTILHRAYVQYRVASWRKERRRAGHTENVC